MFRALIFFCTFVLFKVAFAALQNRITFRGTTLKYYAGQSDNAIFAAATISCHQKGGWLVMPKDKNLNDAVSDVSQGKFVWIGGSDLFGEGGYEWNDGEDLEWVNWHSGQPDDHQDNEDCMHTNFGAKGKWNDRPCEDTSGYICQIPGTEASPGENRELTVYAGQYATSYFHAKRFCQNRRSRLALLQNDDRLENLVTEFDGSMEYWVSKLEDVESCSSVSRYGLSDANCLKVLPLICEQDAPNTLVVSAEEPELETGSDFTVECTASGIPIPEVKWYRDGRYVSHQKTRLGQSSLILHNVSSDDAGMYVCKAINDVGGERRSMKGYSFIGVTNVLG